MLLIPILANAFGHEMKHHVESAGKGAAILIILLMFSGCETPVTWEYRREIAKNDVNILDFPDKRSVMMNMGAPDSRECGDNQTEVWRYAREKWEWGFNLGVMPPIPVPFPLPVKRLPDVDRGDVDYDAGFVIRKAMFAGDKTIGITGYDLRVCRGTVVRDPKQHYTIIRLPFGPQTCWFESFEITKPAVDLNLLTSPCQGEATR